MSSESEHGGPAPRKRSRRSRGRSFSQDSELDRRFDLLSQQLVSHVNNVLSNCIMANSAPLAQNLPATQNYFGTALPSTSTAPAQNIQENFLRPPQLTPCIQNIANLDVSVKEPSVPKAKPERVTKIAEMQRFDSSDWNAVRYTEVQKKYVAFPSFVELKVNEELRRFEDPFAPLRWFQMERSFAALSNAFLTQNEHVNSALQNLIDWSASSDAQLSSTTLFNKLKELFGADSSYRTVSHDILQIICGKRAEVIETRRRSLLKNVKSKYIRDDIEKIPPSIEYIFNPQNLSNYLQKIGGVEKLEKQINSAGTSRPTPLGPSTSFQENTFRSRQNKSKRNNKKDRRNDDFSSKKRGGRKDNIGRRADHKQK